MGMTLVIVVFIVAVLMNGLFAGYETGFVSADPIRIRYLAEKEKQPRAMLICDEPVSALDVSIQAQIINLLQDMKERYDLTMLFISHDLSVVKIVCDRVAVMYLGRICELGSSETLYRRPAHPYTAALLSAIPEADPSRPPQPIAMIEGELPSATNPPPGCRFHTRCPKAQEVCTRVVPPLENIGEGHSVACHFPLDPDA